VFLVQISLQNTIEMFDEIGSELLDAIVLRQELHEYGVIAGCARPCVGFVNSIVFFLPQEADAQEETENNAGVNVTDDLHPG